MRKRMWLEWFAYALADHDAIFDYIEADSPQAAITVDHRIRVQVETLARFPQSGRPGRIQGTRELVISRTPYIVAHLRLGMLRLREMARFSSHLTPFSITGTLGIMNHGK